MVVKDPAPEFGLRTKVEQKTNLIWSGAKIVQQLGYMFRSDSGGSLDFHNDGIFDQQVGSVLRVRPRPYSFC